MRARRSVPGQLLAARRAPARAASSAAGSSSSSRTAAPSASTSPGGTTRPAPNRAHGLCDAADVVGDRGNAGSERAEQRAALVELGLVREDGERRLAERAVDLRPGEIAERQSTSRPAAAARYRSIGSSGSPATMRRASSTRRAASIASASPLYGRMTPKREHGAPVVAALAGRSGTRDGGRHERCVDAERRERLAAALAVHDDAVEACRAAAARGLLARVRRGSRSCAVNTAGACGRKSRRRAPGGEPLEVQHVARAARAAREAERMLGGLQRQAKPRAAEESRRERVEELAAHVAVGRPVPRRSGNAT